MSENPFALSRLRSGRVEGHSGVTLIEMVFFAALALILLLLIVGFYTKTSRLFDTGSRTVALQVDARKLFENLTREVRSAYVVTHPLDRAEWEHDRKLVLYRFASGDTRRRLAANLAQPGARDYPFTADSSEETGQLMDCLETTYSYAPSSGTVEKEEAGGFLKRSIRAGSEIEYSFAADVKVAPRVRQTLATHVIALDVTPLALVDDPAGPGGRRLATARLDGSAVQPGDIALLAIRFRAEDRPKDKPVAADEGTLELVTKIWLEERSLGIRFPGAFSSVDADLEF